jgi:hypothetical protein
VTARLFGDLEIEKQHVRDIAVRVWYNDGMKPDLVKVGPEGYIHGWIYVGHGKADVLSHLKNKHGFAQDEVDDVYKDLAKNGVSTLFDGVYTHHFKRAGKASLDDDDITHTITEEEEKPAVTSRALAKEMSGDNAAKLVYTDKPVKASAPANIPASEAKAAREYLSNGDSLNEFLRTGKNNSYGDSTDSEFQTEATELDKVISRGKLANKAVVYRGVLITPELEEALGKRGSGFTERGFISTSTDPQKARSYALGRMGPAAQNDSIGDPLIMRIVLPAGSNVMKGDPDSKEVVLPRNTKFKVSRSKSSPHVITLTPVAKNS